MMWNLPFDVEIDGEKHAIRNRCDYRVVLDVIGAITDNELTDSEKAQCALFIFYENVEKITNYQEALNQMFFIVGGGEQKPKNEEQSYKPQLMDWQFDFGKIAPPVSRVLGYDVRMPDKYTHWYSFLGAYQEIGDCPFAQIVSIRSKRAKGKKLEKWEREYYEENRHEIDLPMRFSESDFDYLNFND